MSELLTDSHLRAIAKQLRNWERRLFDKAGGYTKLSEIVGKIEVFRPDTLERIGWFVMQDEWLGFEFDPAS
jgi:hypothetical protein